MKMIKRAKLIIPFSLTLLAMNVSAQDLDRFLPEKINGYQATEPDNYYTPDKLFSYINGGAELFISYDFEKVISRTYTMEGQPKIVAEIFDMKEPKNAFGVFSRDREKLDDTYGQGSEAYIGAILFWKDSYYISIVTDEETEVSGKAVRDLAGGIDALIPRSGELPAILDRIPEENLVPESVFYFHHYVWMNALYYISGDNLLNIDNSTDAVLARYIENQSPYYLLMVEYDTEEKAGEAKISFIENYAPELYDRSAAKLEDGRWTGCKQWGNTLVCVFNAVKEEQVEDLIAKTKTK
ncbi:MAG: hypothetical protein KFF49_01955 [Bacteroidales bacterium]|nr:hypothetical protein [Bacteroidales bacterium]